jgi:hypothetical protein
VLIFKVKSYGTCFIWVIRRLIDYYLMSEKGSAIDLSEYIIRVYTDDYRYRLSFEPKQTYAELLQAVRHFLRSCLSRLASLLHSCRYSVKMEEDSTSALKGC